MATTLKAFQQEISSIFDQKKAEHLRDLRQAQQQAVQGHGHGKSASSTGTNKIGGAAVKPKTGKDKDKEKEKVGKAEEVKAIAGDVKEKRDGEEEDAVMDVPDVSIEVSNYTSWFWFSTVPNQQLIVSCQCFYRTSCMTPPLRLPLIPTRSKQS